MNNYRLNTNTVINGIPVTTLTGDKTITTKTSDLTDGGLLQTTDEIIIRRGIGNYKVNGGNIVADASQTVKGKIRIATQTEYFAKDSANAITSNDVANDVRLARFAVVNSGATGLSQIIATGASYNLLTPLLEANETQISNVSGGIIYKDTSNVVQNNILNEASDILFLPSPLNTFNLSYVAYTVKVIFTLDTPTIANNSFADFAIALRTVAGNVKIASYDFSRGAQPVALTGRDYEALLKFYVNGDTDIIITSGLRLFLENKPSPESDVSITLTGVNNVTIFRD